MKLNLFSLQDQNTAVRAMEILNGAIAKAGLPGLGDDAKTYSTTLTEPEINAIYAVVAFAQASCGELSKAAGGVPHLWWEHYGPVLTKLSERLEVFDDAPCPVCGNEERDHRGLLTCECPCPTTLESRRKIAQEMKFRGVQ